MIPAPDVRTRCCKATEVADGTCYLSQSYYTDTRATSAGTDPVTPGAGQSSQECEGLRPEPSISKQPFAFVLVLLCLLWLVKMVTCGVTVCTSAFLTCQLLCGFESRLALESSGFSMWHFLKLVARGFLRVFRFPPLLHRLMVQPMKIKLK